MVYCSQLLVNFDQITFANNVTPQFRLIRYSRTFNFSQNNLFLQITTGIASLYYNTVITHNKIII